MSTDRLGYHIAADACLPGSLQTNPRLSQWLRFGRDGFVEVSPGKVEIGQGILTALAQIVADELDVDLARVRMVPATTAASPNEGVTSGSLSVEHSGSALRYACARGARDLSRRCGPAAGRGRARASRCEDGTIVGPGNLRTSYWELADDALLERDATARIAAQGACRAPAGGHAARRASTSPTRCSAGRASSTTWRCPACCTARVLQPAVAGRQAHVARREPARAACRASSRWCATAASSASWPRPRTRREAGLAALRKARHGAGRGAARRDATCAAWLKSQPVETTTDRRARGRRAGRKSPAPCAGSTRGPSSPTPRWRPPAPSRNGRHGRRARLDPQPGRLQSARRPGAGLRAAAREHRRRARRGRRLLRPERRRRRGAARRRCWRARRTGGRCACSGRARTSWPGRRSAPRMAVDLEADLDARGEIVGWRHDVWGNGHVSRPGRAQDADAARRLAARQAVRALRRRQPAAGRRRRGGAQRRRRSTISRPGRITNHRAAHHADPHLVAAHARAPSPTCSPSSRSWTSWRPSAARTRWRSACAT